mgnify:CR=1 FL=1
MQIDTFNIQKHTIMFTAETYIKRREALRSKVQSGIILLLGNNEAPANYPDNTYKFRQDSSFLYFFGHSHPGYAGVLDIETGEDIFFGNDVDIDDIIWMGPQPSIKELAAQVGVQKTMPLTQLWEVVGKAISQGRKVHFLPPYRYDNMIWLEELTGIKARNVFEPVVIEKTKPLMFVSATRLTPEKGWDRMVSLAKALDENNVNYLWYVFTNSNKPGTKNMIMLPPRYDITDKIGGFDAFIQLSDNEGFCLSIVEALLQGVPVIATDLPVLREIGLNDGNSVILPFDMSDIPIERIENIDKLKFDYKQPKDKWGSVLDKTPIDNELIEVVACDGYVQRSLFDTQLKRVPQRGERFFVTKARYEDLVNYGEKNRCTLVRKWNT